MPDAESQPRILVVDDDCLLLRMLADALREEGLSTATANRADKALEVLEASAELELVITDINMPGMDGLELLARVEAMRPGVRRLVISGRPDLCSGVLRPTIDFLPKPFTARQFVSRVRSALDATGGSDVTSHTIMRE